MDAEDFIKNDDRAGGRKTAPTKNIGRAYIDTRTDVYGIGATMYYLLTARVPGR